MTDIGTFPIYSFPAYTFPTYTWPIAGTVLPIVAEPYVVCIHEEEQVVNDTSATNCAYVPELIDDYSEQNLVYNIDAVQYSTKNTTRICKT
jgi:hypothetical protein